MRVIYFGSGEIGIPTLRWLIDAPDYDLLAVVTRKDAPSGRKMQLCPTPIKQFIKDVARDRIIEVDVDSETKTASEPPPSGVFLLLTPEHVRGNKVLRRLLAYLNADAFLVVSYGRILTNLVLDKAKWPVCVHTSALPKLRGPSPVRSVIATGRTETEVCTFLMTPRMDDGDVLLRRKVTVGADMTFRDLCARFSEKIPVLVKDTLAGLSSGTITPEPQNHSQATYCRLITKKDAWINWSGKAKNIRNHCRAFTPDNCIVTTFREKRIKFDMPLDIVSESGAKTRMRKDAEPGTIICVDSDMGCLEVVCGDGVIRINRLQPENRPWLSATEFINGFAPNTGDQFITSNEFVANRLPFEQESMRF